MPHCRTKYFDTVAYEEVAVVTFPAGLPAFENERRFLFLEQPAHHPLVFLQSLATRDLCFVALPAQAIDPSFELEMEDADAALLGPGPRLVLALVAITESAVTANLYAPIVIDTATLRAVQAIAPSDRYSHQHPLRDAAEPVCS